MAEINEYAQQQIDKIKELCKRTKPLVVIHCITYNHEPYIRDALDGFVMQKTDFPFVAIVHEDVSTDKTAEIVKEYAEKYPDIILPIFEKENQYSKGTLSKVMDEACHATGAKYIAMCEGDDYWIDPHKLQKQVTFLEKNKQFGLCFTECNVLDNNTGRITYKQWTNQNILDFNNLLSNGNQITTLTAVYNTKYLNGYSDLKKPNWPLGDYPLWLYITTQTLAYKLSDITSCYRILVESASHTSNIKKQFLFSLAILEIKDYFAEYKNIRTCKLYIDKCKLIVKYSLLYPRYCLFFLSKFLKKNFK